MKRQVCVVVFILVLITAVGAQALEYTGQELLQSVLAVFADDTGYYGDVTFRFSTDLDKSLNEQLGAWDRDPVQLARATSFIEETTPEMLGVSLLLNDVMSDADVYLHALEDLQQVVDYYMAQSTAEELCILLFVHEDKLADRDFPFPVAGAMLVSRTNYRLNRHASATDPWDTRVASTFFFYQLGDILDCWEYGYPTKQANLPHPVINQPVKIESQAATDAP
jgi:hypothetical protein